MQKELYTPGQVAEKLELSAVNLKKYAALLENNGHNIGRNERGHRVYNGYDIDVLNAMKSLNRNKNLNLEEAASILTSSDTDIAAILSNGTSNDTNNTVTTVTSNAIAVQNNEVALQLLQEYRSLIEQLHTQNEGLKEKIEVLESKMEEKDQHIEKLFNTTIHAIDEQAATQQDNFKKLAEQINELSEEKQPKRGFWSRLFSTK